MAQSVESIIRFSLARHSYWRIRLKAWCILGAYVLCAFLGASGGLWLWPTYPHNFTIYLKWQDALVWGCWCLTVVSLIGCTLVARFLYALRQGHRHSMLLLRAGNILTVRDLSAENLVSIFWAVATTFACFCVMMLGLLPAALIGWTTHLSSPTLVFFLTLIAVLLSLAGLVLAIPFGVCFVVGMVCWVSFCRHMGASQTYTLGAQTTLRIDDCVLAIMHSDKPETLFDLQLLTPEDRHRLLTLLRQRWQEAEHTWNPTLGEEIEALLSEANSSAALSL